MNIDLTGIKGKKVLVTGADGFIGSHLVEELLKNGAYVKALVLYNSFGSFGLLEDVELSENLEIVMGDINDPEFCRTLMVDVSIIYHLAALISIPYSYIASRSFFETNVLGTQNLLEAAKNQKVKRFVHTSTSEVYGTAQYSPMDEKHPLHPQSPYSASKIGADCGALSYYYTFDLPVTILRPFNTFGPRQSARAVIPTIITQLLSKNIEKVKLGSVDPVRDYTFVKDTAKAFILSSLSSGAVGEIINVGTGKGYSIGQIYEMVSDILGVQKPLELDKNRVRPKNSEVWKLICDNKKFERIIGWVPETNFEDGLSMTADWLKEHLVRYKPGIYNI